LKTGDKNCSDIDDKFHRSRSFTGLHTEYLLRAGNAGESTSCRSCQNLEVATKFHRRFHTGKTVQWWRSTVRDRRDVRLTWYEHRRAKKRQNMPVNPFNGTIHDCSCRLLVDGEFCCNSDTKSSVGK